MADTSILGSRIWFSRTTASSNEFSGNESTDSPDCSTNSGSEALLKFFEIATSTCAGFATDLEPIHHLETIGEGLSFSVKAHLRRGPEAYVLKIFKHSLVAGQRADFDKTRFRALLNETHILGHRSLHEHENIVTLIEIALAVSSSNPLQVSPALVLERAPHGTLEAFQKTQNKSKVDWTNRKTLSYDIAAGLKALHDCGIVHGDLKAENVLIFDHSVRGYVAKISDMGSAVILPAEYPASHRMRLSAYTPPWEAPEAMTYVSPEILPKSDVYSLGLLIWRTLVHRDPFLLFDIPLEAEARLAAKRKILKAKNLAGLIPCFIEEEVGFLDANEIVLLIEIFTNTVCVNPNLRSLQLVLDILLPHSGRASNDSEEENTSPPKLASFTDELTKIPGRLSLFQRLHHMVQSQILLALEDLCGFAPVRHGGSPLQQPIKDPELHFAAVWVVFQFHMLGIGAEANIQVALDILYYAGLPEHGNYWKSWVILGQIYRARQIKLPDDRMMKVIAWALRARLVSEFYQTVISGEGVDKYKVASYHGLNVDPQQFEDLKAKVLVLGSNQDSTYLEVQFGNAIKNDNTLLHAAAFYNDLSVAKHLVDHKLVDINAMNTYGETALLIAMRYNSYEVLDLLLARGANAANQPGMSETALYWLISIPEQSRLDVVSRLQANGANTRTLNYIEDTENIDIVLDDFFKHGKSLGGALVNAVGERDLVTVKILVQLWLQEEKDPAILMYHVFPLPIRLASEFHLFEILEFLCSELSKALQKVVPAIEHDLAVFGKAVSSYTESTAALRGAIRDNHHVHRLMFHGKDWKEAAIRTMEVLHKYGFVLEHLASHGLFERTLNFAIASGSYEIVEELLSHQWILDTIDEADEDSLVTPVHQALKSRKLDVLKLLVQKGATVDLRIKRDPRHSLSAVQSSYLHLIASLRIEDNSFAEFLLDQGVPPDIKDSRGFDVLTLALNRCSFNLASLLLSRGCDLQRVGRFGISVLGERLLDVLAQQHDDVYEAVKFILNHDGIDVQSLFLVDHVNQQSVLHIAAAYPWEDEVRYTELLLLLLSYYNKPEQVNFQAGTASRSTALQLAIATHNATAVATLAGAGADMEAKDLAGRNAMDLARYTITKLIGMKSSSKSKHGRKDLDQAFQILSIIANYKSWPDEFNLTQQIVKALGATKPLINKMIQMSHSECYHLGLETEAFKSVYTHVTKMPSTPAGIEDMRRQVNSILEPCLYAESVTYISPSPDWAHRQSDSYPGVRQRIPWSKTVNDAHLSTFQQAAALEWLLDEVREEAYRDGDHAERSIFHRYAITGDPADLPNDHELVRWPPALLDWYVRAVQEDRFQLTKEEKVEVTAYISILRARAAAQARGELRLPPFPADFRKLHFEDLQPAQLTYESVYVAQILLYRCRCNREKITSWTIRHVEDFSHAADTYLDYWGPNLVNALYTAKKLEVERDGGNMRWKDSIGVHQGEGRIERTGPRRRDSAAQAMDNISLQMLRALMQQLGITPGELGVDEEQDFINSSNRVQEMTDNFEETQPSSQTMTLEDEGQQTETDIRNVLKDDTVHPAEDGARESEATNESLSSEKNNLNTTTATDSHQAEPKPEPPDGISGDTTPPPPSSVPNQEQEVEVYEPHVSAALRAYLFHATVKQRAAEFDRDQKFVLQHFRDFLDPSRMTKDEIALLELLREEDTYASQGTTLQGDGPSLEYQRELVQRGGMSVPIGVLEGKW